MVSNQCNEEINVQLFQVTELNLFISAVSHLKIKSVSNGAREQNFLKKIRMMQNKTRLKAEIKCLSSILCMLFF